MQKKRVLIHTNAPWMKTGLAENGKILAKYLFNTKKYDLFYYCSQTHENDPAVHTTPWKSFGCIPADPNIQNELNQDQGKARDVAYGSYFIDKVIQENKIDVYIGSDDIWSFSNYVDRPWWNKINSCLHITVDSLPVLDQAIDQAKKTKNYFTWTKFSNKEIKERSGNDVKTIYGVMDTDIYKPISKEHKNHLRKTFNINENTTIIGFVFRNQLRKSCLSLLKAFSEFKKKNPSADVKIHLHTSYSERGHGWDIPKMMSYFGIKNEDILCTYVCKSCGKWVVTPYQGEDVNCPICKTEKSMITPNIAIGVPHEEMHLVYGLWDAGINAHTSGGLEYNSCNTLLCGLPLAMTNYSCGEDFCEQSFVFPLDYETTFEPGTSFVKSATSIKSITKFIEQVYKLTYDEKREIGRKGREWAIKTFSINNVGKQWEDFIDSLPFVDWDSISFETPRKNQDFKLPENYKEISTDAFIKLLYKEILLGEPDPQGYKNWEMQLEKGAPREKIYEYFINVAKSDNAKEQKVSAANIIDRDRPNKRALFLIKESIGDVFITSSLFESFHEQYKDYDLYVSTDPKFFDVLEGCPHIHKLIPYAPQFENEMAVIGAGQKKEDALFDVFLFPAIPTQKILGYLGQTNSVTL